MRQDELKELLFKDYPELEFMRNSIGNVELVDGEPDKETLEQQGWTFFNWPGEGQ